MSDLSNAKQIVLQFFAADINSRNGVVNAIGIGDGCIRVVSEKPITQQFTSVNGIPIEYHVIDKLEPQEEEETEPIPLDPEKIIYDQDGTPVGYRP